MRYHRICCSTNKGNIEIPTLSWRRISFFLMIIRIIGRMLLWITTRRTESVTRTIRVKSYNESIQHRYRICHRIVSYTQSIQYGYRTSSNEIIYNYNIPIDSSNLLHVTQLHGDPQILSFTLALPYHHCRLLCFCISDSAPPLLSCCCCCCPAPVIALMLPFSCRHFRSRPTAAAAAVTAISLLQLLLSAYRCRQVNLALLPSLLLPSCHCCHCCCHRLAVSPLPPSQAHASAVAAAVSVFSPLPSRCYLPPGSRHLCRRLIAAVAAMFKGHCVYLR